MFPTLGTKASMWANFALAAFGGLQQSGLINLIPGPYAPIAMMGMGLLNGILHMSTGNTPIVPLLGAPSSER